MHECSHTHSERGKKGVKVDKYRRKRDGCVDKHQQVGMIVFAHMHMHTYARTHTHMHTHTHAHAHTHAHTHTQMHTHTRMHTHTHA